MKCPTGSINKVWWVKHQNAKQIQRGPTGEVTLLQLNSQCENIWVIHKAALGFILNSQPYNGSQTKWEKHYAQHGLVLEQANEMKMLVCSYAYNCGATVCVIGWHVMVT